MWEWNIQHPYQPTNIQSKYTIAHITQYTLTHTQTQNNHLKCRPRSTLLVTVLLTVYNYKELITFTWYVQDYCSVILPADYKNIFTLSAKVLIDKNCFNSLGNWFHSILALCSILLLPKFLFTEITCNATSVMAMNISIKIKIIDKLVTDTCGVQT